MDEGSLRRLRTLITQGNPDAALAEIDRDWSPTDPMAPTIADVAAFALETKGDLKGAIARLDQLVINGTATFHTHYRLAEYHRKLGEIPEVFRNHRFAHSKFGWPESLAHGYSLTHDYFSPNIPFWEKWFSEEITAAPLRVLEIGSWQGGSAAWMLDKVISRRRGQLTCIDTFEGSSEHAGMIASLGRRLEDIFDENIARTGHGDLVRKLVGKSQEVLPDLRGEKFDLIYVDGAHEAKYVIQDVVLGWPLVRTGGFMLFDDLNFTFHDRPEQNTARAVEFFLSVFSDDLEIVSRRHQLLVRRIQ